MKALKSVRVGVCAIFLAGIFVACGNNKDIAQATNGLVDTNIVPKITFNEGIFRADSANKVFDSSGEIKINGKEFYGKYAFIGDRELNLILDEPLLANSEYKIDFDFKAINKSAESSIKSNDFTMKFRTNAIQAELESGHFVKDSIMLDKVKLDALLEFSQEIPQDLLKDHISLLDSAKNVVEIEILPSSPKSYKITSAPLESPKDSDKIYNLVLDKSLGVAKTQEFPITAPKITNLDIISMKVLAGNNTSIEVRFNDILEKNTNLSNFVKITPSVRYSVSQANDTITISGNFKQNESYNVEILQGIKSQSNLTLAGDYAKMLDINDTPPQIVFANNGVFMPDSSRKKIAFKSVNVKKATITLKKIYANNITQYLHDRSLSIKAINDRYIYNFLEMGDTIKTLDIDINAPKNMWVQNEVDLSELKDKSGIFILTISFDENGVDYAFPAGTADWKKRDYFYYNGSVSREIVFSNIALIAHKYYDNGEKIIASALDITSNAPLSNITINAISANNQIIASGTTDRSGNAILSIENELKKEVFYLTATSKDSSDLAILKLATQTLSNDGFETDGIISKNGVKAFIYTDRGVYRPGDSVHLNIIARHNDTAIEHPIKLTITDPRNKRHISDLAIAPLNDGVFYYEFKTDKNADTGIYNVNVNVGDNVFNHKIAIESIVPNRVKVDINAKDSVDIKTAQDFKLSLQGDYLFGAPASGLQYRVEVNFVPADFVSKKYKDWTFDNPSNLRYSQYASYDGKLNESGFAEKNIVLGNIRNDINRNITANITARVYENNGRSVSNRKRVNLVLFDSFVGLKAPQNRYVKQGESVKIPVILLDKDENPIKNRKLQYIIYNNNYSWWWDYSSYENFVRSIKSDKNTKIIQRGEITSSDKISHITFDVKDKGEIMLEVRDTSNNQSASIFLYSSSWGEPLEANKITQLKIKSDKAEYAHDDTAKVIFESAKNGKALIVVSNNEQIINRYWIDTQESETATSVKIDKKYAPNLYVSVFMLQDYAKSDNDRALRLYGVIPLKITNEQTKLNLNITAKDEILPNSDLVVEISNKEKKQVTYTLAVVDEGLINLTNFKTPSPWNHFYAKTKLGIQSFDTYDYIIDKTTGRIEKVYAIGGDYMESMASAAARQKDDSADRFKPVVFFTKPTQSDKNGYAKLSFKIPSYVGNLRVMLVAVDKNSYGSASKDVLVSAPVVMLPTIPRSLKINDKFNLPVEIVPIKDSAKSASISIKSDGIIDFDTTQQIVDVSDKKSKTIFFNGVVKEELGLEHIKIHLNSGDFTMEDSTEIDIKSPNPYVLMSKNYTTDSATPLRIESPQSFIKNSASGKITLSASPLLSIDHRLLWLIRYPYGCIEQTTSSVFPQLFIEKLSSANFINKESIVNNINAGIARIAAFQTADGGFSYWQGEGKSDAWGSSYAAHFLLMAKKQGYYVSDEVLNRWQNYQVRHINKTSDIYPLYLLALSDNAQLGIMNEIYENHLNQLSVTNKWLLAASYKMAGFDDIARKIISGLSVVPNEGRDYYEHSYGSELRNKAIILQAYKIIKGEIHQDLYDEIQSELETDAWLSTQTISYALLVFASIKDDVKNSKLEGKITLNGKVQSFNQSDRILTFALDSGVAILESKQKLFVNYTWEGITSDNKGDNIAKNMRLSREFVTIDDYGNERNINVRELKTAQSFYFKLTLHANRSNGVLKNVALTQNLPSGWEIENTRLNDAIEPNAVRSANSKITYTDIRDDKIMWFFDIYDARVVYVKISTVTPGVWTLPAAYAEAMYDGNYQASTDSLRVRVNAK